MFTRKTGPFHHSGLPVTLCLIIKWYWCSLMWKSIIDIRNSIFMHSFTCLKFFKIHSSMKIINILTNKTNWDLHLAQRSGRYCFDISVKHGCRSSWPSNLWLKYASLIKGSTTTKNNINKKQEWETMHNV